MKYNSIMTENEVKLIAHLQDKSVIISTSCVVCASILAFINANYVIGILFLTSLALGFLLPFLFLSNGKSVPNLLEVFTLSSAEEVNKELPRSCSICGAGHCQRQHIDISANQTVNAHISFNVPQSVDEALEDLLNVVMDKYVCSWYREISGHDQLADEIRYIIRFAASSIGIRLCKMDLSYVILDKLIPASICHLDTYLQCKHNGDTDETSVLQCLQNKGILHPAMKSRAAETDYLRGVIHQLFPFVLPNNCQHSRLGKFLLQELLGRFLILQGMDLLADPDTLNLLFALIFEPADHEPWEKSEPEASNLLLKNFSCVNNHPRKSVYRTELSTVLKDQSLLYLFHSFLKKESAINILQFCLTVEDFNRHMGPKDLTEEQIKELHQEALGLYHTYVAPSAVDRIALQPQVVQEIKEIVHSSPTDTVLKLHTTRPLFQAYEYAYNLLEKEFLPLFFNSTPYFKYLCGEKSPASSQKSSQSGSPAKSRDLEAAGLQFGKVVKKFGSGLKSFGKQIILKSYVVNGDEELKITDQVDEAMDISAFLMGERRVGLEPLTSAFRDLSAWRVSIPSVDSRLEQSGKRSFVFVVSVTRIDVPGDNLEELQWIVERRYHEFYILEAKLTEFHGEFEDVSLPPRRSLFSSKGIDFMQTRRQIFEEFLQKLLQRQSLRSSQLLFLFLKSKDEFIPNDLLDLSFGRFLRQVPRKLVKERGQYLEPFIASFISTATFNGKQSFESVDSFCAQDIPSPSELTDTTLISQLFGDNAGGCLRTPFSVPLPTANLALHGVTQIILYVAVKAYGLSRRVTSWMTCLVKLFGHTIDELIKIFLRSQLELALAPPRIVLLIHLIRDAIYCPPPPVSKEESVARRTALLRELSRLVPVCLQRFLFDHVSYREGAETLVNLFQNPRLNKQLSYVLLDVMLEELFPEVHLARTQNISKLAT